MNKVRRTNRRCSVSALMAIGGSFAALPASALELGEIDVQSRLGQPLRASVAYALAPWESLSNSCVNVLPGDGLPGVGPVRITVANGVIALTGDTVLREPMVAARIAVNCAHTANLSREYTLFLDPPASEPAAFVAPVRETIPISETPPAGAPRPAQSAPANSKAIIEKSSRYQVQPGETASEIALRIQDRNAGLWPTVFALVEHNPDAFVGNDPNKLLAGSWLTIPESLGGRPVPVTKTAGAPAASPITSNTAADTLPSVAETPLAAPLSDLAQDADSMAPDSATTPITELPAETESQQPIPVDDNPFVELERSGERLVTPDTALPGPEPSSASPNVTTAIAAPNTPPTTGTRSGWLWWLAGAGVASVLALLLFRRRTHDEDEVITASSPMRRSTDFAGAESTPPQIADESPTDENLLLDAEIVAANADDDISVEFVTDFNVTANDEVDETDVLPTLKAEDILDSEVLPEDEDYEDSDILNALRSVDESTPDEDAEPAVNETIALEPDYTVIEQDYEEELTATQTLNAEIERAAAELAEHMEDSEADDADETAALPRASVTALSVSADNDDGDEEVPVDDLSDTAKMRIESGNS